MDVSIRVSFSAERWPWAAIGVSVHVAWNCLTKDGARVQ